MLKRLWHSISNIGIDHSIDPTEHKRIKLVNQLIFFALSFTSIFIFIYSFIGFGKINIIEYCAIAVYLTLLYLSSKQYFYLARGLFVILLNIHMFLLCLALGIESQIQLLFIPVAALPVVVCSIQKFQNIIIGVSISVLCFCTLYFFDLPPLMDIDLSPGMVDQMRFTFNITALICEVIVIYSIVRTYDLTERRLDESNELLQQQLHSIFENSFDALFLVDWEKRRIIRANKRSVELFEMDSELEFMDKYGLDLHNELPTEAELLRMRTLLNTVGFFETEVLYKTKKGKLFWGALAIKLVEIGKKKYQSVRVTDITIEKQAKEHVAASLHEKEILLSEIHHRVKNNMAVISGLLGLQSSYVEDTQSRELFEESRNRIHSMALIHDKLYQHETFARIDFNAYCKDLIDHIQSSYNDSIADITYSITCHDVFIDIKNAVPCGLILNELLSNSYKHAFKGKKEGEIRIVCTKMGGKFTMMVSDNGVGFDASGSIDKPASLGITLINALVQQVNGTVKTSNKEGTTYYISFEE